MNLERLRLKTFFQFPNDYLDVKLLAEIGFYYKGELEICKCYFCDLEINTWNLYLSPLFEHWRLSSCCPLLTKSFTNNVPKNKK